MVHSRYLPALAKTASAAEKPARLGSVAVTKQVATALPSLPVAAAPLFKSSSAPRWPLDVGGGSITQVLALTVSGSTGSARK